MEATRSTDATTNQTVLMVYDITERKRTELDLLQTKERFRMLVETSPIGLLLMVDEEPYQGQLRLFLRAMEGKPQQFELPLNTIHSESRWYQVFLNPVSLGEDQREISCIAYDITERKEIDRAIRSAQKEKEVLLQEVHHRVKNNLQVISSMLNLQKSFVKDPETLNLLEESTNRIATMSYIHESLYRNTDFANISFAEYLQRLSANLIQSYSRSDCEVVLQLSLIHI